MDTPHTVVFLYAHRFVPPEIRQMARAQLPPGFTLTFLEQDAPATERREQIAQADFLLAYPGNPSAQEIAAAKKLKLVQLLSAGYEWLDLDIFKRAEVSVANNGGANAPTVAEHTLLLILAVYKKLPLHHNALYEGSWLGLQKTLQMREFRGKTLGIIGFGRIGQEVARLAQGFEVSIRYHDTVPAPAAIEQARGATRLPFDDLLRQADVVTLHTPLTPETKGLINTRALGLMKRSAILINTSRGAVIDEPALFAALREGRIAGAGLDVFAAEPLPADHPILSVENVVLTSHIAGVTQDTWSRRLAFGFANICRVASGQAPDSVVT